MNIDRRAFLATLGGSIALRAQKPAAKLTVRLDDEIGRISPLIYGQFAEHVGGLIYDGIWVGPHSRIPNRNGYRLDVSRR
jgi:alpha-L-arabinofuranosidase